MKQICVDGLVIDEEDAVLERERETGLAISSCGNKLCAHYGDCELEAAHECKVCGQVKAASSNPHLSYEGYCADCVKKAEIQMQSFLESWDLRECYEAVHGNPLDSYA